MDAESLVAHSRARFEHETNRRLLREKYEAKMMFAYNGGMFRAGPELLTLLHACPVEDEIVIVDLYSNPIKVKPLELQLLAHNRWQEQMNAWLVEYEQSRNKR